MPKRLDLNAVREIKGSRYPKPYDGPCEGRARRLLADAAGLTQMGINLMRLSPGSWSSQRHWHTIEDEFIFVIEGTVILVTDFGEEVLVAGDCAGFKAGIEDGHHLQNRSSRDALILEVGTRRPEEDEVFYADIDLRALKGRRGYSHIDGQRYPNQKPRNPAAIE